MPDLHSTSSIFRLLEGTPSDVGAATGLAIVSKESRVGSIGLTDQLRPYSLSHPVEVCVYLSGS